MKCKICRQEYTEPQARHYSIDFGSDGLIQYEPECEFLHWHEPATESDKVQWILEAYE